MVEARPKHRSALDERFERDLEADIIAFIGRDLHLAAKTTAKPVGQCETRG